MATTASKDYSKIAAAKIRRPSQHQRPPRIFVYGRNKKGKTTFCTTPGQGKVLILDPEGGTDRLTKKDPDTWPITCWEDMDDAYKFIRSGKHEYTWVALDGLTKISNMALRWVVHQEEERDLMRRPGKFTTPNYGDAGQLMSAMLHNFHTLPYGVILTAQERMVEGNENGDEDEDSEDSSTYYVADLPRGVRGVANSLADVIGRIYVAKATVRVRNKSTQEVEEKEIMERRLWVATHHAYDTGFRSEYGATMPNYLRRPTVTRLVELMETGKATTNG